MSTSGGSTRCMSRHFGQLMQRTQMLSLYQPLYGESCVQALYPFPSALAGANFVIRKIIMLHPCSYQDADMMEEFLSNAREILPYLTRKPHVMTLEHPPLTWKMYSKEVSILSVMVMHLCSIVHLLLGHLHRYGHACRMASAKSTGLLKSSTRHTTRCAWP